MNFDLLREYVYLMREQEEQLIDGEYYWIKFRGKLTIGQYEANTDYPWQIVGSDDIFTADDVEVITKILPPQGV